MSLRKSLQILSCLVAVAFATACDDDKGSGAAGGNGAGGTATKGSKVSTGRNADGTCSEAFLTDLQSFTENSTTLMMEVMEAEGEPTPELCAKARNLVGQGFKFLNDYDGLKCKIGDEELDMSGSQMTEARNEMKKAEAELNSKCK